MGKSPVQQLLALAAVEPVVSPALSVLKTLRTGRFTRVYRDADGDWVQAHRLAGIASPDLHLKRFESIQQKSDRLWFRHYRPQPGDVIVDAGAGIGEDTIVFARSVAPAGRVIAIEAHPRTFRCLEKTIRMSGLANVTAVRCAIQEKDADALISTDPLHAASSIVGVNEGEVVPGRGIDSLFTEHGVRRVDLLKMNIEGAEAPALAGIASSWSFVRNLVVSCHDFLADSGGSPALRTMAIVVDLLKAQGFRMLPAESRAEPWAKYYVYAAR